MELDLIQEAAAREVLSRLCEDLSLLLDHDLEPVSIEVEPMDTRPAGHGSIHVSFRWALGNDFSRFGCWLVPLAEAISLGAWLQELPDEEELDLRTRTDLDLSMKRALLEVSEGVTRSTEEALRSLGHETRVGQTGCQGVRDGVRPAFPYEEGDPLWVAKALIAFGDHGAVPTLLLLPPVTLPGESNAAS